MSLNFLSYHLPRSFNILIFFYRFQVTTLMPRFFRGISSPNHHFHFLSSPSQDSFILLIENQSFSHSETENSGFLTLTYSCTLPWEGIEGKRKFASAIFERFSNLLLETAFYLRNYDWLLEKGCLLCVRSEH